MMTVEYEEMDVFTYYKGGVTQYIWLQEVTENHGQALAEEVYYSLAELVQMLQEGSDTQWPKGSFTAAVVEGAVRAADNWTIDELQGLEYLDTG